MLALALQTAAEGGSQVEEIARTFGVDWPHLMAQIVSFGIVCAVLYFLAYTPILKILAARRQQIADGLANAEKIKAELARIETERHAILARAGEDGKQLIEEARAAAARVQSRGNAEGHRRCRTGTRQGAGGRRARSRVAARRGATTGRTAGRADDRSGHGQNPDRRGSAAAGIGDRQPARGMTRGPRVCERTSGPDGRRDTFTGSAS